MDTVLFACAHNAGRSQMASTLFNAMANPAPESRSVCGPALVRCVLACRLDNSQMPASAVGIRRNSYSRDASARRGRTWFFPVLTWSGLRGGISVALVLALPRFGGNDILLASTYPVIVFSVMGQGLTVRHLLVHYGVGRDAQ